MRFLTILTVFTVTMLISSTWQNDSFGAVSHSETAQEHTESQIDPSLGKDVYESVCASCHNAGIAGAIKLSDKATWKKHIHHGIDHMVESVIKGKGAMPARGGDPNLTDEEIKAAVNYIVEQTQ
jgi:cytochrome c5